MLGKYKESALNTVVGMVVCLLIGVLSLTSAPTSVAQNAGGSGYDLGSITELHAEVQQVSFLAGTEGTLRVLAPDQSGKPQEWTVVLTNTRELREAGITLASFAPGHGYRISGSPSLDPKERRLLAVTITRPDGSVWRRFE